MIRSRVQGVSGAASTEPSGSSAVAVAEPPHIEEQPLSQQQYVNNRRSPLRWSSGNHRNFANRSFSNETAASSVEETSAARNQRPIRPPLANRSERTSASTVRTGGAVPPARHHPHHVLVNSYGTETAYAERSFAGAPLPAKPPSDPIPPARAATPPVSETAPGPAAPTSASLGSGISRFATLSQPAPGSPTPGPAASIHAFACARPSESAGQPAARPVVPPRRTWWHACKQTRSGPFKRNRHRRVPACRREVPPPCQPADLPRPIRQVSP